jgi:hypothetical protein
MRNKVKLPKMLTTKFKKFLTLLHLLIYPEKIVVPIIKKVVMFVPNKLIVINRNVEKFINLPKTTQKSFMYVTGVTTGAAGVAKGSRDFAEAVACQDSICAVVSGIGVTADCL